MVATGRIALPRTTDFESVASASFALVHVAVPELPPSNEAVDVFGSLGVCGKTRVRNLLGY